MRQELIERVELLQNILISRAQYKHLETDEEQYRKLRTELLSDAGVAAKLPRLVRTCRTLSEFWDFVKSNDLPSYQSRRVFIREQFRPLLTELESVLRPTQQEGVMNSRGGEQTDAVADKVWSEIEEHSASSRAERGDSRSSADESDVLMSHASEDKTSSRPTVEAVLHYKVFSLALAAAQPVLTEPLISFKLANPTGSDVDITIECELKEYGIQRSQLTTVPSRETIPVPIRFALKNLILIDSKWSQFDYRAYVELSGGDKKKLVDSSEMMLLQPINTFVFASRNEVSGKISDWSWMIAAWVSKEQAALLPIVQMAREINGGEARGYAVAGDVPTGVRAQVKALYEALKEISGITYDDSATVYHQDSKRFAQRVRLPNRSLRDRAANCLDGSVLFASLLATVGLHPIIVLLPGHAIVGWKCQDSEISDLEFIETIVLAKEPFAEARRLGMAKYAEAEKLANQWQFTGELDDLKEFAIPIDVEKEWNQRNVVPLPWE